MTHVIDSAGAYIPGHGTPTVILFARNRAPGAEHVRTVMGKRGEPATPVDASQGEVWCSITDMVNTPGQENDYVSVADLDRSLFCVHPWSIGGGGAGELKALLDETHSQRLGVVANNIGIAAVTLEDEAFSFQGM